MKKFLRFHLSSLALILIIIAVAVNFYFLNADQENPKSPLPKFLTYFENKQVSSLNLWLPSISFLEEKINVSAKSALVFDLTSNKIIYSKNPDLKLPMASLTKIMTAIVALENKKTDDQYLVHSYDLVGENIMGLSTGEILNLEELLYGLMLNSGNDSAEVLASNFEGGRTEFIKAMNSKAKALGLKNTNFTNPTGLEGDGDQYTTAYDLLVISKYAVSKFPLLTRITSTFQYQIQQTSNHKYFYLENGTNLISSYPGVRGLKDGYTPEAGLCLATYLEYKNHKLIGIILGSGNRRQEMKDLLDYSLKSLGIKPPPHS